MHPYRGKCASDKARTRKRAKSTNRQWLQRLCTAAVFVSATIGTTLDCKAGELTTAQQLEMYRNCRKAYEGYNLYFAKKMCGCTVQAYIRNIPAEEAGATCYKYAKTN